MSASPITPQWMIQQGCSPTAAKRFSTKINIYGPIPEHRPELGPCHVWLAAKNYLNYGLFHQGKKMVPAHRFAWRLAFGSIPVGQSVLHKCDNAQCVNPNHLFLGTQLDNMRDMVDKGRVLTGEENPSAVLTWTKVRAIRQLRETEKLSARKLGRLFGVCTSTITWIISGQHWKE